MSLAQISPTSVVANPSHVNPQSQNTQLAATAQATQAAQSAIAKSKSDTVTLSPQALKKNAKVSDQSEETYEQMVERPEAKGKGKN